MSHTTEPPTGFASPMERREIDGIPVWIAHHATRYAGALLFRVGIADEVLPRHGQSHIVEHLALFGLGPHTSYPFNGYVSGLTTGFHATGRPEEVGEFLSYVSRTLHELPFARLNDEVRVLRTEASARQRGFIEDLFWLRYGAVGHGLRRMPELALLAPDAESVRSWVAERFTAGNAALWFSGPPPDNLRLSLPPGSRVACREPYRIPSVSYPSSCPQVGAMVGISFEHNREDWLSIPLAVVQGRVFDYLRFTRGLAYDVGLAYEPVDSRAVHAAIAIGCLAEHAGEVRDVLLATVESVARDGATDEEVERIREQYRRQHEDPDAGVQDVANAAINELLGYPVRPHADLLAELETLSGRELGRRLQSARPNAMLASPAHLPKSVAGFLGYPLNSTDAVKGRTFRHVQARFPWSKALRLVIGPEGASFLLPDGRPMTVRHETCAGAFVDHDGTLTMWGEDGFEVMMQPSQWRGATKAIAETAERVPAGRLVRIVEDRAPTPPPPFVPAPPAP